MPADKQVSAGYKSFEYLELHKSTTRTDRIKIEVLFE